jgi:hypothetical protein
MLLDYGPFIAGGQRDAGEVLDLPGHNSSYRRDVLLGYGERLTQLLGFEAELHAELRRRGERMIIEPRARLAHVNVTRLRSWLPERWHAGRIYAGALSRRWPRRRRVFYALASPAIPLLRVRRALRDAARTGEHGVGRALPFLCLGLLAQTAGEAYGFLRGPGSMTQLFDMELRRLDYLAADDPMRAAAANGQTPR